MRTDFFIASRLKLRQQGSKRSAVSVRVSTAGVVLSIAIMLLTIAIVSGFKQQITDKIVGFDAQITIASADNTAEAERRLALSDRLREIITGSIVDAVGKERAADVRIDLTVSHPAMLKTADNFSAVVFRCYGEEHDNSFVRENIVAGDFDDFANDSTANSIILSQNVADRLSLVPGDRINTLFFIDGRMRLRNFHVAALYNSNFGEYDDIVAYAPIPAIRRLMSMTADEGTRIEISGLPFESIPAARQNLQNALTEAYYAGETDSYLECRTVLESGALYFNWLELLDTNVVVIIILMSAISVFTLIASLFILILERVNLIGTLKTLGADNRLIRRIFIILASRILMRGLAIGNLIALAVIIIQYLTHVIPLDPDAYYISFVPVSITVGQVILLNIAAIIIGVAVMIIPSLIISRMSPARTVRFE